MNKLKKLFPIIIGLSYSNVMIAHDFVMDGIYYNITSTTDLTVEVTHQGNYPNSYSNKYSGAVTIPSTTTYDNKTYSVTSIGAAAFTDCNELTSIAIPGSVKSMGIHAFNNCNNLSYVTIQEGITAIGGAAFSGCVKLASITIPSSVKEINTLAFDACTGLESVIICNGVTSIGEEAFRDCSSLVSIVIPPSITNIMEYAFLDCVSLSEIHISDVAAWCNIDFEGMESNPLYYAHSLYLNGDVVEHLNVPYGVTEIKEYAFLGCSSLKSFEIPQSVTSFGNSAFEGCSGISSVVIPKYVTNLGVGAFDGCTGELIVNGNISDKAFSGSDFSKVIINEGVTSIGVQAFSECNNLTSLTIPSSVTNFGQNAFSGCTGELFVNCDIPDLTRGWGVFSGSRFTRVVIGDGVTSIGSCAFYHCPKLETVVISDDVISIEDYAFGMCENLKSIYIPEGVKCIEENTFYACENISDVYISDVEAWCNIDFKGHPMDNSYAGVNKLYLNGELVTELTIPNTVSKINPYAFWGFDCITSVTIPESVASIGQSAFSDCENLSGVYINSIAAWCDIDFGNWWANPLYHAKNLYLNGGLVDELDIPYGVKKIKNYAFYECSSLTSLYLSSSVTSIGEDAFYGCRNLETIDISYSSTLTSIDGFGYCSNLMNIAIPESVTSIGPFAFYGCDKITNIYIGSIESWCKIFFKGNLGQPLQYAQNLYVDGELVTDLVIPDNVTSIGLYAFYNCTALSSITIPESVEIIDDMAFAGCTGEVRVNCNTEAGVFKHSEFSKLTIGENITEIGNFAFRDCNSFTSVSIPASVTKIGEYAFLGCNNLEEVHISNLEAWCNIDLVTNPFSCARSFYLNGELVTDITIPESITEIKANTFNGCNSLTSIAIPDNVTSIKSNAFAGCISLTAVSLSSPVPPTLDGTEIFPSNTATLTIPVGSYRAYEAAGWTSYFSSIKEKEYDNALSIEDVRVRAGKQVTLSVNMKNITPITSIQFDLVLPEGITITQDEEGYEDVYLSTERTTHRKHTVESVPQPDGSMRIICYSGSNAVFSGTEGEVLTITLDVSKTLAEGDYAILMKDLILTERTDGGNIKHTIPSMESTINVFVYTIGDVNGDESIDVTDISGVVSFIMNIASDGLIEKAADVNEDGAIDVVDISDMVDLILNAPLAELSLIRSMARTVETSNGSDIRLTVLPFTLEAGEEKEIYVLLDNPDDAFDGIQFDLYLPDGVSVPTDADGYYYVDLGSRTTIRKHALPECQMKSDNVMRVMCYSNSKATFKGEEGDVLVITVVGDDNLSSGIYDMEIKNIVLSRPDVTNYKPADYTASILSGNGGEDTAPVFNGIYTAGVLAEFSASLVNNAGITSIDLTESLEVDAIGMLTTGNPNTVVYLAEGMSLVNTYNVVSGDECNNLVLTDGYAFDAPMAFTALKAIYTRELASGKYGTIVLPFAPNTDDFEFYELVSIGDNTLIFDEVIAPVANTPYLYKLRDGKTANQITANDVTVSSEVTPTGTADWQMVGSFTNQTIAASETADKYYYAYTSSDNKIHQVTNVLTVNPYRAYFTTSSTDGTQLAVRTRNGKETLIDVSEVDALLPEVYYDLSGRRIDNPVRGVYIVNGKKVLVR